MNNENSTSQTVSLADEEGVKQVLIDLANSEDIDIPRCVASAYEAITLIREHHAAWTERQRQP